MLAECDILRFNRVNCVSESLKRFVVVEEIIDVHINGDFYASFHCLPMQIRELIVGHLLTEGIVGDAKNIVEVEASGNNVYVKLSEDYGSAFRGRLINTFCGGNIQLHFSGKVNKLRFNRVRFSAETVF
ncbi:MAG: formate dehydrogenase accessory sulfurtransferase FdhD, partial [Candidatus Bathyarchaeia archaeon]